MVKTSLVILALFLAGCPASEHKSLVPCDSYDHAAQFDLAENAARCKFRLEQCETLECRDQTIATCDRYVDERCKLPESE
jgi:hypothetical protein